MKHAGLLRYLQLVPLFRLNFGSGIPSAAFFAVDLNDFPYGDVRCFHIKNDLEIVVNIKHSIKIEAKVQGIYLSVTIKETSFN